MLKNLANILMKRTLWWDKKWVLACQLSFSERTARVKLELTDFKRTIGEKGQKQIIELFIWKLREASMNQITFYVN